MPNSDSPKKTSPLNHLLTLVFVLVFLLAIGNIVGTNSLATQGVVLDDILSQTQAFTKENQIAAVEIGKINNLGYLEKAAAELGFQRVRSNLIITAPEAVAAVIQR